ncbi:MAG: hypothetical protein GY825_14260, partial [Phycisphaeraceae bacterium]|nr:hypothetical protein [Phycisphaeraceae bacterium]
AKEFKSAIDAATGDPAKQLEIAQDFASKIAEALGDVVPPRLSEALAGSVTGSFRAALEGESVNFTDSIGSLLFDRANDAMTRAFEESLDSFDKILTNILDSAGEKIGGLFQEGGLFGGLGETLGFGEGFGELLGNTAMGIVGAGVKALTAGDTATSQAGRIQSAVTSAERVRGIVAGPTQIAVAQVDRAISDAFVETNVILGRIEVNTRRTANDAAPSGGGSLQTGGGSEATEALANESPTIT